MGEFDPHAVQARPRWSPWWRGRAGRREYWTLVAALILIGVGLSYVPGLSGANSGLTVVLMFAQARRLHDFGRSGWWAPAATLAPLAVMLPLMAVSSLEMAGLAGLAVELALVIWIGAVAGDADDNRFGPAPPFTVKRTLTGR